MNAPLRNTLIGAAALLAAGLGYWAAIALNTKHIAGGVPRTFVLSGLDGHDHRIEDWGGKLVLVNFWATWCPPCREEIPLLMRAQQEYGAHGFQVVSIAIDDRDAVTTYADSIGISYPVLLGSDTGFELMQAYGNNAGVLPYSVLISPHGRFLSERRGAFSETELIKLISGHLPPIPAKSPQ